MKISNSTRRFNRVIVSFCLVLFFYLLCYAGIREFCVQTWEKDSQPYVIFPKGAVWVYYVFRPLSALDGYLTGQRFHIGPHENVEELVP